MGKAILEVQHLTKVFEQKGRSAHVAVDDVSFTVGPGECVGLVGGSGSGKSTIAQMVTGLLAPTSGSIVLDGREVGASGKRAKRDVVGSVQMVFQNPAASFNPRRTLGDGAGEALRNQGVPKEEARERVCALFERCGLDAGLVDRYPREVSGGQCQRAAIARALAPRPALVVLDEATSALDVTVQAQVVDLLCGVQGEMGCAYLFICHDLALVQGFCDRVLVMKKGRIVEEGLTTVVLARPSCPYTRELLDAVLL